jgi:DNA (cytosine-5)-methyltransferase 1
MSRAYYNENDPYAATWLRELIADGLIAQGDVDERSIMDVTAEDVQGYRQCHWFAGIGGWSLALRLAGVPDNAPVWTGSCPCQPLSCAGSKRGHTDERHLWPEFYHLIEECRPAVCFGEQVASGLGPQWLAGVRADLEATGYAVAAADLCAASVGAPHIRQRLYWVAYARYGAGSPKLAEQLYGSGGAGQSSATGGMGNALPHGPQARRCEGDDALPVGGAGAAIGVAESLRAERGPIREGHEHDGHDLRRPQALGGFGACGEGFWSGSRWHLCRDAKSRRVPLEPSLFPLAPGLPGRVGILRGAGNAIVPQVAATFVRAAMEALR